MTNTEENYLKALYHLSLYNGGEVNLTLLSKELQVSKPTATSMAKNLKKKKLVNYEKYKPITLTKKGRKAAASVIRKHRLTEMFLVDIMNFGWEEVHEIAEQIEHVHSPKLFQRMDEMLDFPTSDPHGSPIPDRQGNVIQSEAIKLTSCSANDEVILIAISNSSPDFLSFLNNKNLPLKTQLTVKGIEEFDQTMIVEYNNQTVQFSQKVCNHLLVRKIKNS